MRNNNTGTMRSGQRLGDSASTAQHRPDSFAVISVRPDPTDPDPSVTARAQADAPCPECGGWHDTHHGTCSRASLVEMLQDERLRLLDGPDTVGNVVALLGVDLTLWRLLR